MATDIIGTIAASIQLAGQLRKMVKSYAGAPRTYSTVQFFGEQLFEVNLRLMQAALQRSQTLGYLRPSDIETIKLAASQLQKSLSEAIEYLEERMPKGVLKRLIWSIWAEEEAAGMFEDIKKYLDTMYGIVELAKLAPNIQELGPTEFVLLPERELLLNSPIGYKQAADWARDNASEAAQTQKPDIFVESYYTGLNSDATKGNKSAQIKDTVKEISQSLWWTFEPVKEGWGKTIPFPTGLLPCIGFQKHRVMFLLPRNVKKICTLRHLLFENSRASSGKFAPLEARYALAAQAAEALFKIHSAGLSHGAVRSNTLLFLEPGPVTQAQLPTGPESDAEPPTNDRGRTQKPGIVRRLTGRGHGEGHPNLIRRLTGTGEADSRRKERQRGLQRVPSGTSGVGGEKKTRFGLSRKRSQSKERGPGDDVQAQRSLGERQEVERLEPSHNKAPGEMAPLPQGFGSVYLFYWAAMAPRSRYRPAVDNKWYNDIYRHPKQQGAATADERRNMGHDIYSLGVCLLEIGLWETLVHVVWKDDQKTYTISDRLAKKLNLGKGDEARSKAAAKLLKSESGPGLVKTGLVEVAEEELPQTMGTRYAQLVKSCLTCLDEAAGDAGHIWKVDFADQKGREEDCREFRRVVLGVLLSVSTSLRVDISP